MCGVFCPAIGPACVVCCAPTPEGKAGASAAYSCSLILWGISVLIVCLRRFRSGPESCTGGNACALQSRISRGCTHPRKAHYKHSRSSATVTRQCPCIVPLTRFLACRSPAQIYPVMFGSYSVDDCVQWQLEHNAWGVCRLLCVRLHVCAEPGAGTPCRSLRWYVRTPMWWLSSGRVSTRSPASCAPPEHMRSATPPNARTHVSFFPPRDIQ